MKTKMRVEIWSDIMCPFCYIGKRHFEQALQQFPNNNKIEIVWKSFQLDPSIPQHLPAKTSVYQYLAERKGMSYEQSVQMHERVVEMAKAAGLEYNFDKAIVANSFNAHRLIQLAKTEGLGDQAEERLFLAYFTEGKDFGDPTVLTELGQNIGLSPEQVSEALSNDEFAQKVKHDISEAEEIGVNGVPFFVFDRKYAVSGAQPSSAFLQVIERSFEEWKAENPSMISSASEGPSCKPGEECM
jgi:protein disulfide-isomerase